MNFKLWLESAVTEETKRRIYEKITTVGMPVRRGERPKFDSRLEYRSDPGDLGRGIYYSTDYNRAEQYGKGEGGSVVKSIIRFKNPIVLSAHEAYELADKFHTIKLTDDDYRKIRDQNERRKKLISNAQALTDYLIGLGHDGLVCIFVDTRSELTKRQTGARGKIRGDLEIVDYRPYMKGNP